MCVPRLRCQVVGGGDGNAHLIGQWVLLFAMAPLGRIGLDTLP